MELYTSHRKGKRYAVVINNRTYHFGQQNGKTYIDEGNKTKRENYIRRHSVKENWDEINPGSLSRYILWGKHTNLEDNIKDYIKKFNIK